THRAPVQAAPGNLLPLNLCAADKAWLAVAAVDVVRLFLERLAGLLRRAVPGSCRDDAAIDHAGSQQRNRVLPDGLERSQRNVAAFGEGIKPCAKEQLRAVDVAYAREHGLIHQQHADRRLRTQYAIERGLRVVAVEAIRTEAVEQRLPLGVGPELAGRGAAKLKPVDVAGCE